MSSELIVKEIVILVNQKCQTFRTSLEKVGQFKTSQLYKICQESELCLRIHKKRNVGSEPEPLQVKNIVAKNYTEVR